MSDAANVTAAKPKKGGAIYRAPIGTALPTDATTALASAFVQLGYSAEDGLTNSNTPETDTVRAWGGDIVLTPQSGKDDTFKFKLLEGMNSDVLASVYGSDNVTVDSTTGAISVTANSDEQEEAVWVFEMILKNNAIKRIVLPSGKLTDLGDITYTDGDPVGYDITITAFPDTSGNTHYEYISKAA